MISYVVKVINLCAIALQNVLFGASFVGSVIVSVFTVIFAGLYDFTHCVVLFLQILYEDNVTIFSEDIPNFLNNGAYIIYEQITGLLNGFVNIYQGLEYKLKTLFITISYLISGITAIVVDVSVLIKNSVILMGQTVWLLITFIPVHLPQLLKAALQVVKDTVFNIVVDAYMRLLKITNFLSDVPLESFIGLISAIIVVRLTMHYREAIQSQIIDFYWNVLRKLMYCYYTLLNYFADPEVRVITHMASGQDMASRDNTYESNDVDDNGNGADALCVICQERQKCVLTLPCRHVCLCTECCRRLYGYQRTCPICRTFIYHAVTIYL